MNQIWELDASFANYWLPSQKLISKRREGAKVIKKHDAPITPHARAVAHPAMRKRSIITMNAAFKVIKPAALSRRILALTGQLETLAQAKRPAPVKPAVSATWNNTGWRRKPREATN